MGNDPVNRFDEFGLCDDSLDAAARSAPKEVADIAKETASEGRAYIKQLERLQQLAKDAKKLDVKELARRFKILKDSFHEDVKKRILRDFKDEFQKRGLGNNPDVLVDAEGHVVLRTASGLLKEVWNTGVSALSYCK
jgi:hypothetical protein